MCAINSMGHSAWSEVFVVGREKYSAFFGRKAIPAPHVALEADLRLLSREAKVDRLDRGEATTPPIRSRSPSPTPIGGVRPPSPISRPRSAGAGTSKTPNGGGGRPISPLFGSQRITTMK